MSEEKKKILLIGAGELDNVAMHIAKLGLKKEELIIIESNDKETLEKHGLTEDVIDKISKEHMNPNTERLRKSIDDIPLPKPIEMYKPNDGYYGTGNVEQYKREEPKIGRNSACPCGSGKKYKKCCGSK